MALTTSQRSLITPQALLRELPANQLLLDNLAQTRTQIRDIILENDSRLLVVVGPCSIHDTKAALEYAELLKDAATRFADDLLLVMRVYFEKPRTTLGWRGFINDPFLDNSFDINHGLTQARKLLLDLANLGVPAGTEFLDMMISHYLRDLIAWGCIGARTSESQIHRELASDLPFPVGFKNSTDGNIKIAIDAVNVALHPHCFLSIDQQGLPTIFHTHGNDACHIILRGSQTTPNYTAHHLLETTDLLRHAKINSRVMIDCSHGNSGKNYQHQTLVANVVAEQLNQTHLICGVMLESNLVAGKQTLHQDQPLTYGQSITDACLSWKETLPVLEKLARAKAAKQNI